jgi:hypothetical protein
MTTQSAINDIVSWEVIDLHRFFEAWFGGQCENSDVYFDTRLRNRLAPDFCIVMPGGRMLRGAALLADMRQAHGANLRFRINIRNVEVRSLGEDGKLILATYEEWQKNALNSKPPNNARISSALLKRDDAAPNGLIWVHVHETWLPGAEVSADPFDF